MYAYGKVTIERPNVLAVPHTALTHSGDRTFCWLHDKSRAVQHEIQTGVNDEHWIEVTNHRRTSRSANQLADPVQVTELQHQLTSQLDDEVGWVPFDGSEDIILGDLAILTDGCPVDIANATDTAKLFRAPIAVELK